MPASKADPPAFGFAVSTAGAMLLVGGSLAFALAAAIASGVAGPGVRWRTSAFIASGLAVGFGAVLFLLGRRAPAWSL